MIIFTKRLTTPVVRCSDRYGFVLLADMALQSGHDSDKGWHNAVADGALQDCRIDRVNRYEYISTKAFSTPAGVLSHLGQRHMIILQRDWWFCKGGGGASWHGAACYTAVADIKKKLRRRADRFGTESSPLADWHWRRQRKNRFTSDRVRAPPGGGVTDEALSPKIKSIRHHRSVVRC